VSQETGSPTVRTSRLPATFSALRHRNFRLWFIGQTLSMIGTWMQSVAQGWLVYQLTGSEFALGAVSFIGTLPTLFFMLPAGAFADRIPRRRMLLVTQTVMMLLAFTLATLAATHVLQVWHIGVLACVLGIANSFDAPTRQALAVEMVEDRADLMNAIALNSTIINLARVIGPAIGGAVLAAVGATWCFVFNGLSFLAVLAALSLMRLPEIHQEVRTDPLTLQIAEGVRYVWRTPVVRTATAIVAVSSIFGFSYSVLLPAFAVNVLHIGEAGLGGLNTAVGLGALAGSLMVASMSRIRRKGLVLAAGSLLFPAILIVFAFSKSFVLSLAALSVIGVAFVAQNATANTLIQSIVPDKLRGRVMAVYTLMFFGTAPFGSLQAGSIAQAFGPAAGVAVGAVLTLAFALFVFFAVPVLRRVET
jgi:MFS family permease